MLFTAGPFPVCWHVNLPHQQEERLNNLADSETCMFTFTICSFVTSVSGWDNSCHLTLPQSLYFHNQHLSSPFLLLSLPSFCYVPFLHLSFFHPFSYLVLFPFPFLLSSFPSPCSLLFLHLSFFHHVPYLVLFPSFPFPSFIPYLTLFSSLPSLFLSSLPLPSSLPFYTSLLSTHFHFQSSRYVPFPY